MNAGKYKCKPDNKYSQVADMHMHRALQHFKNCDEKLHALTLQVGPLSIPEQRDHFTSLVKAIVSQQLSTKAAATIWQRLGDLLGDVVKPARILETPEEALRVVGLSRQKANYLRSLATAFLHEREHYEALPEASDAEVLQRLTAIKGIGTWTAQMFLIFTLRRADVFPVLDLGIRRAMERLYFGGAEQSHEGYISVAQRWSPHCSVASLYLWESLKLPLAAIHS